MNRFKNFLGNHPMRRIMNRTIIFSLFLILLFACPGWGATYYVKNGGNDSLDGKSDANAWAHVPGMYAWTGGASRVAPGDTVYFDHEGTWSGGGADGDPTSGLGVFHIGHYGSLISIASGTAGNPITIDGASWGTGSTKTRATIKATRAAHGAVVWIARSYINFQGFEIDGSSTDSGGLYVLYNMAPVSGVGSQSNITIDNCIIHDVGATDTFQYGIHIGPQGTYTLSNVTVTNTTIYDTMHEGIAIYPSWNIAGSHPVNDTVLIRNCTVYNTGMGSATKGYGEALSVSNDSRNVTLEFNTLHNGLYGISLRAGDHDMTWSPTNVVARYNIIYGNALGGITTGIATGASVSAMSASFYGNLIYSNGQSDTYSSCFDIDIDGGDYSSSVLNFYNNTIYSTKECTTQRAVVTGLSTDITGTPTLNFKNNIVYSTNGVAVYDTYNKLTHSNNLIYRSSGAGDTHVTIERPYTTGNRSQVTTWESSAQNTDPSFTGGTLPTGFTGTYGTNMVPNTNYFSITSGNALNDGATLGSPYNACINGAGLTSPILRPQGAGYDIGAYEYAESVNGATPPTPPTGLRIQ